MDDALVHRGTLFLRVQTLRRALVLVSFVERPEWTASAIRGLRDRHPELETFWPDAEREDGGLRWARASDDR